MTIGFDPRNVGKYGGGATGIEVCMTQDANQYKMAKCIAQEIDDGNFREGVEAERKGRSR